MPLRHRPHQVSHAPQQRRVIEKALVEDSVKSFGERTFFGGRYGESCGARVSRLRPTPVVAGGAADAPRVRVLGALAGTTRVASMGSDCRTVSS
jgi:hypothetical protein